MDHIFTRKLVGFRDFCGTGSAAAERPAFFQEPWPRGPVDAAVYASASQKRGVRGIDDGVHMHFGDIVPDDL